MTNSEIELKHAMLNDARFNKTHQVVLKKVAPGSLLFDLIKAAESDHAEYANKLMLDRTKNDSAKRLMSAKNAENLLMKILRQLDKEKGNAAALKSHIEEKLTEILRPSEPSPAGGMERQLVLQNLKGMKFSEIHSLVREGDKDVAKAIESPLAKKMFKLGEKNRQQAITEASERCLLTETEYKNLMISRQADFAFDQMGDGLALLADRSFKIQKSIGETIVEEAA